MFRSTLLVFFLAASIFADPFSFNVFSEAPPALPRPEFFNGAENTKIAYFRFPASDEKAVLLFIHGGGAHSGAGYSFLARKLSLESGITVVLLDLRGHGISQGERGDAGISANVNQDIKTMLEILKASGKPLLLGGHSSGSGAVLNFMTETKSDFLSGLLFISPEFGFRSETARDNIQEPFATARIPVFILSAFSGRHLFNSVRAVNFHYPERILKQDPLLLDGITVSMAYALTPEEPHEQFADLSVPVAIFIGQNDELIDPAKLQPYIKSLGANPGSRSSLTILEGKTHLSVLTNVSPLIGTRLKELTEKPH